jgi:hypothetical protein
MTSAGTTMCLAASGAQRWGQVGAARDRSHKIHSKECQRKLAIPCVCVGLQSGGRAMLGAVLLFKVCGMSE